MPAPAPLHRLFLHFFDTHFLEEVARGRPEAPVAREAELAVRFAVLAARTVFVPAASYFESRLCRQVLDIFADLFDRGVLVLVGGGSSVFEFAAAKLARYDEGSTQHMRYAAVVDGEEVGPPFRSRLRSATQDLRSAWVDLGNAPELERAVFGSAPVQLPLTFTRDWHEVPDRLGTRAFIPEYVVPLLLGPAAEAVPHARIASVINSSYFASFAQELRAGFVTDLVFLASRHAHSAPAPGLSYRTALEALRRTKALHRVASCVPQKLLDLRDEPAVAEALLDAVRGPAVDHEGGLRYGEQMQLVPVSDLEPRLAQLKATARGRRSATLYHRRVATLLADLFFASLGPAQLEQEIDEGRKRLDVVWPNVAESGFFRWLTLHFPAAYIIGEAKNYVGEVSNPELDQLTGRFAPWRSKVGLLLCRQIRNRPLLHARCRDAVHADRGLVIALDDDDFSALVATGANPQWGAGAQSDWLYEHVKPLLL